MGKAKRAKLNRQNEEARKLKEAEAKRAEKKENAKIFISVIAVMLAVALVVGSICFVVTSVRSTGNYLRNKVSVYSDNYEINNAMLAYLFADNFYMQKSYFDYYKSYFGLDTSSSLKSQQYSDDMTWYDYFLTSAIQNAASMLVSGEAAREDGIFLDDEDRLLIEKEISLLKEDAEDLSMDYQDYLNDYYGLGVKEDDIRDALELYYLSTKYYYYQLDSIDISDDAVKAYYEANSEDYMRVSYKSYTVEAMYESGADDATIEQAYKDAEDAANVLASAEDVDDFDEKLTEYLTDLHKRDGSSNVTLKEILEEIEENTHSGIAYDEDYEYMEWLFDGERKAGDVTVVDEGNGKYSVYCVVSPKAREEYATKNVRHILFNSSEYESDDECLAAAEAVLAEFNATDKSEEAFAKLAKKYTSDTGSVYTGGLYENVAKDYMVEEFDSWIYDESREYGDVEIIETESYGYHIMFYCGDGAEAWEAEIISELEDEKYEELSAGMTERYEVKADVKKAGNIPDINK